MAESQVGITPGAGANVDTRTTGAGKHRQVIVLGDASSDSVVDISDVLTALESIKTNTDGMSGYVDGLETLLTSVQTLLTALGTNTDGLEGLVDQLEGYTDGLETTLSAINSNTDTVESLMADLKTYTDGIEGLLTTIRDNADAVETKLDTLADRVGAVDASPTANTLQDRLKGIKTTLDTISTNTDGLEGFTDGVETLLTNISGFVDGVETLLTSIGSSVDGLEGFSDDVEGLLTTLRDNADTLETKLQSIIDNTDGLEGYVDTAETLLTAIRDYVDTLETKLGDVATATHQATQNTLLTSIRDYLDTAETLLAAATPAGTNSIGKVVPEGSASGVGLTPYLNTALSNTKQSVKTSSARLYGYHVFNPGAAVTYLQIFNKLAADVTVGSTTPDMVLALPSTATSPVGVDGVFEIPISFGTGIVIAATTTPTGSTAPATAILANLLYL